MRLVLNWGLYAFLDGFIGNRGALQALACIADTHLLAIARDHRMITGPLITPRRKLVARSVAFTLWLSGTAWLILHYFGRVVGGFGPEANPAEPWALRIHGALAFLAIGGFGWLWGLHIEPGWKRGQRKWTGGLLAALTLVLIVTGYLLYYLGEETLRAGASLIHWLIGLTAIAPFLVHGVRMFARRSETGPS